MEATSCAFFIASATEKEGCAGDISTSIGNLSKPFNFFIHSLSQEMGPLPSQDQGAEPSERMARKPSEPDNRGSNPRGPAKIIH